MPRLTDRIRSDVIHFCVEATIDQHLKTQDIPVIVLELKVNSGDQMTDYKVLSLGAAERLHKQLGDILQGE